MNKIAEIYGTMVFDQRAMEKCLDPKVYEALRKTIHDGEALNPDLANAVAAAMKEWAMERGATHYTHWFQPLSGTTSEKHDAFLDPQDDGSAIAKFSGKELIQGEPDASSFPNGGLRATFEARGYTAWDPTSYAFIKDEVLCIPTAFCSYTGEALDKKTPLLRSMKAIEEQVRRAMDVLGENNGQHVTVTLGAEQEFFLIPEKDYAAREDLVMTGRTLFGSAPCKGQELEEHYFGSIRPTVNEFMKELDDELWALGISARTKHNEVAPAQHELAPVFTNCNRGIDENLLTMEKMRLLAGHHGLACLLHEKPFEGINGSGKHNNWALSMGKTNLLDPGDNPIENLRFLVILAAIVEAVDDYQELLRAMIASAGNDHRLGANEAPPAIVSIYLGDELSKVVNALISDAEYSRVERVEMDLGVDVLPNFLQDTSDRNRTSPFAFTGNKFEFRMPGSNANLSDANLVLNTAVAKGLKRFADALDDLPLKQAREQALLYVKDTLRAHERILFNGNGYSAEWEAEAARRGLANNKTTASALPCMIEQKTFDLFSEFNVLAEAEVRSRYEIKLEKYTKLLNIEARVMERMSRRTYLPAITRFARETAEAASALAAIGADNETSVALAQQLAEGLKAASQATQDLLAIHAQAENIRIPQAKANFYADNVVPAMEKLREEIDALEIITSRDVWPVPSYNNMLFYV
ncbi:MAG: glutamine synthetase III [Eggerthellales bacterium]|nr:glutamine synthetase III [Eggerthellales bacterium]